MTFSLRNCKAKRNNLLQFLECESRVMPTALTQLVRDISPGESSSSPSILTEANGTLFFIHNGDGSLWKSDGTMLGTQEVWDGDGVAGITNAPELTAVGGIVYFHGYHNTNGHGLWRSDGTYSGTYALKYGIVPRIIGHSNGILYFRNDSDGALWKSNGTSSGTQLLRSDISPSISAHTASAYGMLYFSVESGINNGLWKTDGTVSGTKLVTPAGVAWSFALENNLLYFSINGDLYSIDGPNSTPFQIAHPQSTWYGGPSYITHCQGSVFFGASTGSTYTGQLGNELWSSDGTSTGTNQVRDIRPGPDSSNPRYLVNVNDVLYFRATDGKNGYELWRSDGTSNGTRMVKNINPGSGSSTPTQLMNVNGVLYFTANDGSHGKELWKSDGSSNGTVMISDLREGAVGSNPDYMTAVNRTVFISANDGVVGEELFVSRIGPTIESITSSSTNGAYTTGQTVSINLHFSESVTLANGIMTLTLDTGAKAYVPPFGGTMVEVIYQVGVNETTPDLDVVAIELSVGASLQNSAGYDAIFVLPNASLSNNANIIVNPLPPTTVSSVVVNNTDVQRSRLTKLDISFAFPVDASLLARRGVISLVQTSGVYPNVSGVIVETGAVGSNGRITITPSSGMTTSISLTFDNADGSLSTPAVEYGSLTDGYWQLRIPYLSYSSALNDQLLRRLFGDFNNDGTVDGAIDFPAFGNDFNVSQPSSPFDFNVDGIVDGAIDFPAFGARLNQTL